jgi:hypothetical protein
LTLAHGNDYIEEFEVMKNLTTQEKLALFRLIIGDDCEIPTLERDRITQFARLDEE